MAITDIEGKFLYVNDAYSKFSGYTFDELKNQPFEILFFEEDLQEIKQLVNQLFSGKITSFQTEKRYIRKDGQVVWGLATINLFKDEEKNVTYRIAQIQDITEKKKLEQQLLENEKQYRIIAENSSDIIAQYTLKGICEYVSPSVTRRLGYKVEEILGKSLIYFTHPDDRKSYRIFLDTTNTQTIYHRVQHKCGHFIWFETKIRCIYENNKPSKFLSISRDITKHKMIMDELQNTNKKINNILESITDGFLAFDEQDRFIYINHAAEKIINCPRDQVIYKPLTKLFKSGFFNKLINHYFIVKEQRKKLSFEAYFSLLDAWFVVRMYPTREGVSIYFLDITKQKKLELELMDSEERYRTLVETAPVAISVLVNEKFAFINSPGLKLFRAERIDEIIGKSIWSFLPEEEHAKVKESLDKVLNGTVPSTSLSQTYFRLDQTKITVFFTANVINYNGKRAIQAIFQDITEQKKIEERMQRSEKLSIVGQLAAGVAHEIRNPMTSIKGFMQLAKKTNELKPNYIDIILSELDRTETIIYEFLSLAKPNETSNFKKTDLKSILYTVLPLLETQAHMHNVTILHDCPDDISIECDENQLKQVFINLIKNALEASYPNGIIEIFTEKSMNHVVITIKDNGCGISEERLKKLGEPFYSTKEKGTGLGLLVSYKIIENHNGKIQFTSEEGKGTTVEVTLPLYKLSE